MDAMDGSVSVEMSEFDKLMAKHPWLMRWEILKMRISGFVWRFHPRRNRWCGKCGEFVGNSRRSAKGHVCKK